MTEGTGMQVDTALVRELAELLDTTQLTEIEVTDGERRIRVVRKPPQYSGQPGPTAGNVWAVAPPAPVAAAAAPTAAATDDYKTHPGLVRSPIVGTAYLTADPSSPPFITEGKAVKEGDTLLIVEAMKVMNPITAPRDGVVKRIFIQSEQPVEYDEPLVIIE